MEQHHTTAKDANSGQHWPTLANTGRTRLTTPVIRTVPWKGGALAQPEVALEKGAVCMAWNIAHHGLVCRSGAGHLSPTIPLEAFQALWSRACRALAVTPERAIAPQFTLLLCQKKGFLGND